MHFAAMGCLRILFYKAMVVIAGWALANCGTAPQADRQGEASTDRMPTAAEIAAWHENNGLVEATAAEISEASKHEVGFADDRAAASHGGLRIIFRAGKIVGSANINLSTTSAYVLQDKHGKELSSAPGCRVQGMSAQQKAWFAPDGKQVLVYEYVHECNGPPPLAILFYEDPENPGAWRSRFLDLPGCLNMPFDEGRHTKCRGLLGDEVLIEGTSLGTVSKKKISAMKERHPFPFSVG